MRLLPIQPILLTLAALLTLIGLPAAILRGLEPVPAVAEDEAVILREECAWAAARVTHFRRRLLEGYDDPDDARRERELLMFYERYTGKHCGG